MSDFMSPATLFYQQKRSYSVGAITFDIIMGESHKMSSTVTKYRVEKGSQISDYIINDLMSGTFQGLITNFSLYNSGILLNNSQIAFDELESLWRKQELVDIVTCMKVYKQVAIIDISIARDVNSGETLTANISFQEFIKVSLQQVEFQGVSTTINAGTTLSDKSILGSTNKILNTVGSSIK